MKKQKQTKQSSKQSNYDDKGKDVVKSELVSKKILPEIENVRTAHPLDRSLDDDVIMAINHVPSLLDLGLSSKTTSTMTMETKRHGKNHHPYHLDCDFDLFGFVWIIHCLVNNIKKQSILVSK